MADQPTNESEEFGSGLEATETQQQVVPSILDWARNEFEGLPEDITEDKFAENIVEWQAKAAEAQAKAAEVEELRRKVAEYEAAAQAAYHAQQETAKAKSEPSQQAAAAAQAAATQEAIRRRYEAPRMEPGDEQFLTEQYTEFDPKLNMYKPKVLVPQVMNAVSRQNELLRFQNQFGNDFLKDPYTVIDDGVIHSAAYKKLADEFNALKKYVDERVVPLEKTAGDLNESRFMFQNEALLYQADPENPANRVLSPAGQIFTTLVEKGMDREKALETTKAMQQFIPAQQAPVQQAKPEEKPVEKPKRFGEQIVRRRGANSGNKPGERRPGVGMEIATNNFIPRWDEIREAARTAE